MSFEWYLDFVDKKYAPTEDDLIALFKVVPSPNYSIEDAAGRIASESSIGTWTTLTTMNERIRALMAKAYEFNKNYVKVAYPKELFEEGNVPQLVSSVAGNIFGMKAIESLRLLDVRLPKWYLKYFKGPQKGIQGVRDIFRVYNRPLLATVPKPKVGMTSEEHANAGFEAWVGGIDLLKDDENLSSQPFNRFEERVKLTFRKRDAAEEETGEKKDYLVNITSETKEMIKRARLVKEFGGNFVMVDILTVGWSALQTIREECEDLKLAIHAHRAFHAAFTRNPEHGMSMLVVAKLARLIGVDNIHIGTVVGKLESPLQEVKDLYNEMTSQKFRGNELTLDQEWYNIKPTFPVSSGGLHPGIVQEVMKIISSNIIIQVGGGLWGHPMGGRAGAKAIRQAIDAYLSGVDVLEYAKEHKELKVALEKWGVSKPS